MVAHLYELVPNHWQTPIYLFAIWKLGAIPFSFPWRVRASLHRAAAGSLF